jgi:divalent metal cation (Fe/Co/Zn/Cd) transporter
MEGGVKTVVVAFFTNGILAVAKFVAFFFTGSSSLLAEAFHSTAVTTNQRLLHHGHTSSRRRATRTHQFGYGRARCFWSFVLSFLAFNVGALVALYEAYHKWAPPEAISSPLIAYGVLTPTLLLDGASLVVALRQARREKKESYWQYVRRTRNPEVPRTMYLGPEDLLVEAEVEMEPRLLVGEAATAIDEIERDIRDCVGKARIIAIEPTVTVGR